MNNCGGKRLFRFCPCPSVEGFGLQDIPGFKEAWDPVQSLVWSPSVPVNDIVSTENKVIGGAAVAVVGPEVFAGDTAASSSLAGDTFNPGTARLASPRVSAVFEDPSEPLME